MSSSNGNGDHDWMEDYGGLSNVQRKMLALLADGHGHTPKELHGCLVDEMGPLKNITPHLTSLRKKLRPHGEDVLCQEIEGQSWYRLVRYVRKV